MGITLLFSSSLIVFFLLSATPLHASKPKTQEIKSAQTLNNVITNYTLKSYAANSTKTGELQTIHLPENFSGIEVDIIRLRCGSLLRYGAKIKEFNLGSGVMARHCTQRVILIRQSLGPKWTSVYYNNNRSYQLISPVLALSAYSLVKGENFSIIPPEVEIRAGKNLITIDFSGSTLTRTKPGLDPVCASFGDDGEVVLSNQTRPNVCCAAAGPGRFGLVVVAGPDLIMPLRGKVGKWKIAAVSSIGGALGAALLSLLLVAMFANAKKKARMDEMERRAYEEEALQVSMVGHVRAVTANGTRTAPTIEQHECRNSRSVK
ncbi:Protein of unknown function (DUF1191 [Striga hermonthica]|uniref:Uncharacterized protein n=1 Tax=Striga hermonthica TaxID=68872 RepID=A0A9N7NLZ2_STRHE|nr:Protein of unknown function (DUF1191 [Striga hermonthica]